MNNTKSCTTKLQIKFEETRHREKNVKPYIKKETTKDCRQFWYIKTQIWTTTINRSQTNRRSAKKSVGDNGAKSTKQNDKSTGWSKDCGSEKQKKIIEGSKFALS